MKPQETPKVIAVCGKGGVGKTTSSAILASLLAQKLARRTLAVDADHASGLSLALGIEPVTTLEMLRIEATERLKRGKTSKRSLAPTLDYLLFDALVERESLAFLAVGRQGDPGCYCSLNRFLRSSIAALAAQFEVTLIDAEAGVEQVNRDVVAELSYLLLVTDTSAKGLRVAETIRSVTSERGHDVPHGLLVNRVRDESEVEAIRDKTHLDVVGWIPEDDTVRRFDAEERSFLELPDCPAARAFGVFLQNLAI